MENSASGEDDEDDTLCERFLKSTSDDTNLYVYMCIFRKTAFQRWILSLQDVADYLMLNTKIITKLVIHTLTRHLAVTHCQLIYTQETAKNTHLSARAAEQWSNVTNGVGNLANETWEDLSAIKMIRPST